MVTERHSNQTTWQLNENALQDKLVERKVIVVQDGKDKKGKMPSALPEYTSGMVDLSRQCIADVEDQQKQAKVGPKSVIDSEETGEAIRS